jgi:hypothetical protein
MNALLRAVFAAVGICQCAAVWASCEPPPNTRTDVGAAKHLLIHFDLVGLAVVLQAQNSQTQQSKKLHFPLTFKGAPGEAILKSPFNSNGSITVTNSQTSLGLPVQASALVALTRAGDSFVYSECAASIIGDRDPGRMLRALSRLSDARLAK